MIRAFIALPIPEALRSDLALLQGGVPEGRWVSPENFHITLSFLGDVEESTLRDVDAALLALRGAPFDVTLQGAGAFGGAKPTALYAGVAPSPALEALQGRVERAALMAGARPERRAFTPHVTLAYLGRRAPLPRVMAWLEGRGDFWRPPFRVEGFTLFRSDLGHGGSVYTPLAEYSL